MFKVCNTHEKFIQMCTKEETIEELLRQYVFVGDVITGVTNVYIKHTLSWSHQLCKKLTSPKWIKKQHTTLNYVTMHIYMYILTSRTHYLELLTVNKLGVHISLGFI